MSGRRIVRCVQCGRTMTLIGDSRPPDSCLAKPGGPCVVETAGQRAVRQLSELSRRRALPKLRKRRIRSTAQGTLPLNRKS